MGKGRSEQKFEDKGRFDVDRGEFEVGWLQLIVYEYKL